MFENLFDKVSERIGDTLQKYNVPQEKTQDVINLGKSSLEGGLARELKSGHVGDLIDNMKDPDPHCGRVVTISTQDMCQKLEEAGLDPQNARKVSDAVLGEAFQEITTKAQQQNISDEEGLKSWINSESKGQQVNDLNQYSQQAESDASQALDKIKEGLKDLFGK